MADELPTPRVERDAAGDLWITDDDGEHGVVIWSMSEKYDDPDRQPMTLLCVPVEG